MGDLSSEPSMEDILSSIKRIIAEEGDAAPGRGRRIQRPAARDPFADAEPAPADQADEPAETVLELDQPVTPPAPKPAARTAPPPASSPAMPESDVGDALAEAILSARATQASRGQLEALSRLIVKPETPGQDTLEGLVREMLRPMLSEWLDANLPRIVEALVAREIARISGRND